MSSAGAAVVALVAVGVGVLTSNGDERSRQGIVAQRGATEMPFDLDGTTHDFDATTRGGVQMVIADDPGDADQIALVRSHLHTEVQRFRVGDFGDPAASDAPEVVAALRDWFAAQLADHGDHARAS